MEWRGVGNGSYSGTASAVQLLVTSPANETAIFEALYEVTFSQSGLPPGTTWGVDLNGSLLQTSSGSLTAYLPNGSYHYEGSNPITGSYGARFVSFAPNGTLLLAGSSVSAQVNYTEEFWVDLTVSPPSAGSLNESSGWRVAHALLIVMVSTGPWWALGYWNGSGSSSRSGRLNPLSVQLDSPVNETAMLVRLFAVTILSDPASCGPVSLSGSSVAGSSVFKLTSGTYNLSAPVCQGYSFLKWETSPQVTALSSGAANSTLLVSDNGTVTAIYLRALPGSTADPVPLDTILVAIISGEIAAYVGLAGRPKNRPRERWTARRYRRIR